MALAKDALALLMLHEELDVRLHRECIELIGEAWDIPAEEQREPLALLEEEQASLRTGEGHVLLEEELPMNASGTETLERTPSFRNCRSVCGGSVTQGRKPTVPAASTSMWMPPTITARA